MRIVAVALMGCILAACVAKPAPAPAPPVAPPAEDMCGAAALQSYVGKLRSELPPASDPSRRREVCTTCAMTRDYRPDRVNIFYDTASERITKINCG